MDVIDLMERAVGRLDGWMNLITGVGTRNRSKRLQFHPDAILGEELLEQLYVGDAYANRICRVVPEEALRQPPVPTTGDPGRDAAVAEAFDALGATSRLTLAWTWARVFGGGAVLVGADDGQDPREPLREDAVRSVDFLDAVDARELRHNTWETDRRKPLFGEPLTYRLQRSGGGGANESAVWHRSRLVIFDGAPTTRRRRQLLHGWGESELQRLYSILAHFNGGWEATGSLLQQASQGVLKIKDLMAMMAADKRDVLKRRFEMMDLALGVTGSMLIGEDEDYSRTEVGALTGVADLLTKNLLLLSGAAEIPVTVLMGQSPAGLSATGESDVRWFYDRTKSAQTNTLLPRHRRLARLVCLARNGPTSGQLPPRLTITYPPLWQPTPMEQADLRMKQATTDGIYIDKQVVTADEVAASRFRTDGWNPETTIDLGAREAAMQADRDAADATRNQGAEDAPGAEHASGVADVIKQVLQRELPRENGVALLVSSMGMTLEDAEAAMGEAGRTAFTAPEPGHAAALADAQGQVAQLTRSRDGVRQILSRVLERNKNGELVVGRLIGRAPTDADEGDVLEEGDTIPAEGDA